MLQDFRFELRQLRRAPAFALTAVFTLALGVCASVTIFAFVDGALIKPLPYPDAAGLVGVYERVEVFPRSNLSHLDYVDWKRMNSVFVSLSAYQGSGVTLTTREGAQRAPGARVSDDFFRTLAVAPVLGRDFRAGEDLAGAPRVTILSYRAWQSRFGGRAGAVGESVTLDGEPHLIVGVLPRGFHFAPAGSADFWTTLHPTRGCDARRSCHNLFGVARLRPGVSVAAASSNIAAIARQLEQQYPESNRGQGSAIVPLAEVIAGDVRSVLLVLLAGAALLLLIATINVSSLLLVRAESRRQELAVRSALGASRARVLRQFVAEGLLLVSVSVVVAVAFAYWATRGLLGLMPANVLARLPFLHDAGMNWRVAVFTAGVSLLALAIVSLTPAVRLFADHSSSVLNERAASGAVWRKIGGKLVVAELVTAMILLVGAGLLGKSLYRLMHEDLGFQSEGLATVMVSLPDKTYATDQQQATIVRDILQRVSMLPGVESAGASGRPPLQTGNTVWVRIGGRPFHGEHNEVHFREVTATYLSTLRARLTRGRFFTEHDDASKPRVVIINQTLARHYFSNEDPVGRRIFYHSASSPAMEVVGVVEDVKEGSLDGPAPPTMYVAFAQEPTSGIVVIARTDERSASALLPSLPAAIHELDRGISTFAPRTMTDIVTQSQPAYLRRSSAALVGGFAVAAWLMGIVGLYGVIAYSVGQRTREIGIRLALGAQGSAVQRMVVTEAAVLTATGLLLGAGSAVAAAMSMRGLLFGVRAWDAATLCAAAAALGISAIGASYIPARRAARLDPNAALRTP